MPKQGGAEPSGRASVSRRAGAAALVAMNEHFVEAQYVWTSFLLEHLVAVRAHFGDLDTALLLTVIGLSTLKAVRVGETASVLVNAHSLALVTGIPRETVRRKLAALGRRGWIEKSPNGAWSLQLMPGGESHAGGELHELTKATNARIGRLVEQLVCIGLCANVVR